MNVTDPIADMLTRIRNAQMAKHASTKVLGTKVNLAIAKVLDEHGYVSDVEWLDERPQAWIRVGLRYTSDGDGLIRGIRRESTPGHRRYVKMTEVPKVLNGLGIAILSTSKGILTGDQAKAASAGGELLATVW